ncbi:hypothetical protein [Streptomyces sp. NPDC048340]|uniref:hypothetical protein n=1 Tax=Streptomyces sp. NPDC048340 TaxID=3365537 RepID=UPI00371E82FC
MAQFHDVAAPAGRGYLVEAVQQDVDVAGSPGGDDLVRVAVAQVFGVLGQGHARAALPPEVAQIEVDRVPERLSVPVGLGDPQVDLAEGHALADAVVTDDAEPPARPDAFDELVERGRRGEVGPLPDGFELRGDVPFELIAPAVRVHGAAEGHLLAPLVVQVRVEQARLEPFEGDRRDAAVDGLKGLGLLGGRVLQRHEPSAGGAAVAARPPGDGFAQLLPVVLGLVLAARNGHLDAVDHVVGEVDAVVLDTVEVDRAVVPGAGPQGTSDGSDFLFEFKVVHHPLKRSDGPVTV